MTVAPEEQLDLVRFLKVALAASHFRWSFQGRMTPSDSRFIPPSAHAGPRCRGGTSLYLLDNFVCPPKERLRDRQAEGLGGLEVDDQIELRRLLDGEVAEP